MTTNISTTDLDFVRIRESLKQYFMDSGKFTDYNFEGSGLSALLDVLAYNTHFQMLGANFSLNEAFLDSAQLRSSVVSHAKSLNYVPKSKTSARSVVDISVVGASSTSDITLPKYTKLSTSVDNTTYTFYTLDEYVTNAENNYIFSDVEIFEGRLTTKRFIVDSDQEQFTIYVIPDENVFSDSMSVEIREGLGSTNTTAYRIPSSIEDFSDTENIFLLAESTNNYYELTFGDGIIGTRPQEGSIIEVTYLSSSGADANEARSFTSSVTVNNNQISVNTVTEAFGGAERESIASIRFNAPKNYAAQNRAVTEQDYRTLIENSANYVESINVWGGQDNIPPQYGKTFISIKPIGRDVITDVEEAQLLENVINSRNIASVRPILVDPVIQFVEIRANIDYDSTATNLTQQQLENKIRNSIVEFGENELINFESKFRRSALTGFIDDSDDSIISSDVSVFVQRRFNPTIGVAARYDLAFTLPLASVTSVDRVVQSDSFQYIVDNESFDCTLRNKPGSNVLEIFRNSQDGEVIVVDDAGFIDPSTNTVSILPFRPSAIQDAVTGIRISAVPSNQNTIVPVRNALIRFDEDRISVTVVDNA